MMIYHGVNPTRTPFSAFLNYLRFFDPVMLEAERRSEPSSAWWEG